MTEEKKYYVPDISEFHVGFEFEFRQLWYGYEDDVNEETDDNKLWVPEQICENDLKGNTKDSRSFGHNDYFNVFDFPIRVKYLNRNDIINLGWEPDVEFPDSFSMNEYGLALNSNNRIIITDHEWFEEVTFHGYIYNKSELRWLMKRLGIL